MTGWARAAGAADGMTTFVAEAGVLGATVMTGVCGITTIASAPDEAATGG
jgi:hypothetical protein